jgi:hypothetical protein
MLDMRFKRRGTGGKNLLRLLDGPIVEIRHANRSFFRARFSPSLGIRPVRFVLGIIACVGIALTLFSLLFGFRSVPANSVGVKLRFGAFAGIAEPGLTYVIPYVDERRAIGPSPTGGCTRGGCAPRNKMRLQPVRNS